MTKIYHCGCGGRIIPAHSYCPYPYYCEKCYKNYYTWELK